MKQGFVWFTGASCYLVGRVVFVKLLKQVIGLGWALSFYILGWMG